MGKIALSAALVIAVLAGANEIAGAQPRDTESEAQQIFTGMMSPFCPGLLLADCPSPAAFDLRVDIRRRLDAGESRADIERDLYHQYGEAIRAVPPARGWGRVLWIAPAIVMALTFAALWWFLARSRSGDQPPIREEPDAAMKERLERELDDMP